jgi:uncharacterized membrane protein YhaH (DUF805 family)
MHYYIEVLKKYAVFKGRARRAEYWYFVLFSVIISIVLNIISKLIGDQKVVLSGIYGLAVLIPTLAVAVRRLHDIGRTGWWMLFFVLIFLATGLCLPIMLIAGLFAPKFLLFYLIPLAIFVWSTIWMCTAGQPGDNKYGPNPKSVTPPSSTPPTPSIPETPTQAQ